MYTLINETEGLNLFVEFEGELVSKEKQSIERDKSNQ